MSLKLAMGEKGGLAGPPRKVMPARDSWPLEGTPQERSAQGILAHLINKEHGMDIDTLLQGFINLHSAGKVCFSAVPLVAGLLAWLRLRLGSQRRYLQLVGQLPHLHQYHRERRRALTALDPPWLNRLEDLEVRIAGEISFDPRPSATSLTCLIYPRDRDWLCRANRQLASDSFRSLADDLLRRLLLLLDSSVDYQSNFQRRTLATDSSRQEHLRTKLRDLQRQDFEQVELQLKVIKRYLAGQLEVDLYTAREASMLRSYLDQKYHAYSALTEEDQQLAG